MSKIYILVCWLVATMLILILPINQESASLVVPLDKFIHLFLFAGLAWLFAWNFATFKSLKKTWVLYLSFVLAFWFAFMGEYAQVFVPGRSVSVYDLLSGEAGIMIALGVFYVGNKKSKNKK